MKIVRTNTPDRNAAKALSELLLLNQNNPVLLLLSGGSAFTLLELVPENLIGPDVTIGVLDERYSSDPLVNNFKQLSHTSFFKSAMISGAQVIDTSVKVDESCESVAKRFESDLHTWVEENVGGKVIATMGIGSDGHTVGIMPNITEVNFNGEKWIVPYSVSKEVNQYTDRITTTFTFLRDVVDEVVVYATGDSKQSVISSLERKDIELVKMPAQIINELSSATLFTEEK